MVLMTEAGYWNPLLWLLAFIITAALVYVIRSRGKKKYRPGTQQTMPFFSGNLPPEKGIKAVNLYWGFFEALEKYYRWLKRMHTGMVNDYIFSFVLLLIVLFTAVALGGLL